MPAYICTACGTQYPPADAPPKTCTICEEERQYVPPSGQSWATLDKLASAGAIKPAENTVVILTGTGLKAASTVADLVQ